MNSASPAAFADDSHRPVARIDELDGRLDYLAQHHLDVEVGTDRDDRFEERVHPVPGGNDRLQPDLQLGEQVIELETRQQPIRRTVHDYAPRDYRSQYAGTSTPTRWRQPPGLSGTFSGLTWA